MGHILIDLFLLFMKISVFSFGGGYVLIGYLQHELTANSWISAADFLNIVSISQMTPGPIAINAATFVGYKLAGVLGSIVATVASVVLPAALILFISVFYNKYQSNKYIQSALLGIRPVCAALIIIVGINFAETAIFSTKLSDFFNLGAGFDYKALLIFIAALLLFWKAKIKPLWLFTAAAVIGLFIF